MKYIWEIKTDTNGYYMQCSKCKRKISVKDVVIANRSFDMCPFCKNEMDMASFDYDKLLELANGEDSNV